MEISAKVRYLIISPRKAGQVANLIRGMDVESAKGQLKFSTKRAASVIYKLLNSAAANAKNNFSKQESLLYIKKILVDRGPTYKRFRPTGRGFVSPRNKKTSHITIVLDEKPLKEDSGKRRRISKRV